MANERSTVTKKLVINWLRTHQRPLTLETIHAQAAPQANFSTIYRIVKNLETVGKIRRIEWRERGARFEWIKFHHHHVWCEGCERYTDVTDTVAGLNVSVLEEKTGFQIFDHTLELIGRCKDCQRIQSMKS